MAEFVKSVLIEAPIERVFRFHERDDALSLLSPAFPPVRVVGRTGNGIEPGARLELRIGVFTWIALHTAYEKNRLFEDRQIRGPFAKWVHRHEFESEGHGTRLTDRVDYRLPGGPAVQALLGWIVNLGLDSMFAHRHRVTRRYCAPTLPAA
jgi:ligand-binding SRPBCC domain-containing protein